MLADASRKSQIAIRFAYLIRKEHPDLSVFWIHASNVDRFSESYFEIARECKIPGAEDPKADILHLITEWLGRERCRPWLMIIDNADDASMFFPSHNSHRQPGLDVRNSQALALSEYIPDCFHGAV